MPSLHRTPVACALVLFGAWAQPARAEPPLLTLAGDAGAGYVRVSWPGPGAPPVHTSQTAAGTPRFQVQQSQEATFPEGRVIYEGPQRSSFVSGLPDGDVFFRARVGALPPEATSVLWGPWSEPKRFTVLHHSLGLAAALFSMGALVFLLTLGFLLREARRSP